MTTAEMLLRLGAGVGLGALIGLERQYRARMAGLQTNAQVAAGVTLFVLLSAHGFSGATADPTRVAAQIVRDRLSGRRSDSARRPHRERFEHRGHAVLLGGGRGARRSRHVHRSGGRDRHRARCPHDAEAQSRRQPTYSRLWPTRNPRRTYTPSWWTRRRAPSSRRSQWRLRATERLVRSKYARR